jgi:hypothetical protein
MSEQRLSELSDDEFTILLIADQGEALIPIGRWSAPVQHLVQLGYLRPLGNPGDPTGSVNNIITAAGKVALLKHSEKVDKDLARVFREGHLKRQFIEGKARGNTCRECEHTLDEQWAYCPECGTAR